MAANTGLMGQWERVGVFHGIQTDPWTETPEDPTGASLIKLKETSGTLINYHPEITAPSGPTGSGSPIPEASDFVQGPPGCTYNPQLPMTPLAFRDMMMLLWNNAWTLDTDHYDFTGLTQPDIGVKVAYMLIHLLQTDTSGDFMGVYGRSMFPTSMTITIPQVSSKGSAAIITCAPTLIGQEGGRLAAAATIASAVWDSGTPYLTNNCYIGFDTVGAGYLHNYRIMNGTITVGNAGSIVYEGGGGNWPSGGYMDGTPISGSFNILLKEDAGADFLMSALENKTHVEFKLSFNGAVASSKEFIGAPILVTGCSDPTPVAGAQAISFDWTIAGDIANSRNPVAAVLKSAGGSTASPYI